MLEFIMVDLVPCRRDDGSPTKFKRRRLSPVRDYPRHCGMLVATMDLRKGPEEIANVEPCTFRPVLRKYPLSKFRKGVTVTRDFPVKQKAPAALGNHISDPIGNSATDEKAMPGCARSDAFDATVCNDDKQDNPSVVRDCKPSDVSPANNVRDVHTGSVVRDCKPSDVPLSNNVRDVHTGHKEDNVKDSSLPMVICDEQGQVDVPVATNAPAALKNQISDPKGHNVAYEMSKAGCTRLDAFNATNVHVCTDAKQVNLSNILDSMPSDVPNATNVPDIHVCIGPKEDNVKDSNASMGVCDEQGPVGVSFATKDHACIDYKESMLFRANGDEQSPIVSSELDDNQVVVFDEEREKVASIAKQSTLSMVRDEQCPNDYQAAFSGEDCEKALFDVTNSQACFGNNLVITNEEKINCDKVKEVIDHFREVYLELLQEGGRKRIGSLSFEVASLLKRQQKWINMDRRIGPIPGVEVGDCFEWRAELSIIGLHCQYFNGIDYMELHGKILATSIVDSGRYDNVFKSNEEIEYPDTLIYFGEGENPKIQSKKYIEDQKLERGNLALKNSAEAKNPIRVIRKFSFKVSRKVVEKKFVYDGLYFVDGCQQEIASSGKLVFKFLLKRFPGQPKRNWAKPVWEEKVCLNDISLGKERIPIRAMNAWDDEKPLFFNYVTNVIHPKSYKPSMIGDGCDCDDGCSDSEDCPCFIKNGGDTYNYEERLIKAKPFIIECGPSCKCFTSCINRVSQRGIRFPLEVFKTKTRGWGVRSRSFIPCGSFICEYTGEILREKEAERRIGDDEYLFDLVNNHGGRSSRGKNKCFTIDAARFGNVGRFVNHSCSPNLFPQNVLFDHNNESMPHIMLFAMEDIPPLTELTYDYNYNIGEVCDVNGNIKMKPCYCGSRECSGRMY
ncbi:hypothetical protein PTKIN_Ptkin05aG0215300 [Pterospermum kingtungense]